MNDVDVCQAADSCYMNVKTVLVRLSGESFQLGLPAVKRKRIEQQGIFGLLRSARKVWANSTVFIAIGTLST